MTCSTLRSMSRVLDEHQRMSRADQSRFAGVARHRFSRSRTAQTSGAASTGAVPPVEERVWPFTGTASFSALPRLRKAQPQDDLVTLAQLAQVLHRTRERRELRASRRVVTGGHVFAQRCAAARTRGRLRIARATRGERTVLGLADETRSECSSAASHPRGRGRQFGARARAAAAGRRVSRSLTVAELVDAYLAQHDVEPVTIEKLRWLLGKAVAVSHAIGLLDELSAGQRPRWTLVDAAWTPTSVADVSSENGHSG